MKIPKAVNRRTYQGRIQDFGLGGGAHLKKLRRAEGGAKMFGVFRVKNHDFTQKNHIFYNFRGGARWVRPPPWIHPCIQYNGGQKERDKRINNDLQTTTQKTKD